MEVAHVRRRTQRRFGYQWSRFNDLLPEFERHFWRLVYPLRSEEFSGKVILDAGCGYGRFTLVAAAHAELVVGMDFSDAIYAGPAARVHPRIRLVQGDILHPPFRRRSFDVVFSLGVLHHMDDPFEGFKQLTELATPGGTVVAWVYSADRRVSNRVVELLRRLARPLSERAIYLISLMLALPDFALCKAAGALVRGRNAGIVPTHFRVYAVFPFRVCWADWFDRLAAPIRQYYKREDLDAWLERVEMNGSVRPTDDFGWTVIAHVPADVSNRQAGRMTDESGRPSRT